VVRLRESNMDNTIHAEKRHVVRNGGIQDDSNKVDEEKIVRRVMKKTKQTVRYWVKILVSLRTSILLSFNLTRTCFIVLKSTCFGMTQRVCMYCAIILIVQWVLISCMR